MSPECCQTPVLGLGLGVDFIFPLSQQEEQQQEEPSPNFPHKGRYYGSQIWDTDLPYLLG